MDGEKAILLAKSGLLADLQQCGLHKLKSCAKRVQYKSNVQKNNRKFAISPSWDELKPLLARSMAAASSQDGKLKRNEVSALKPEEHRTYLIKLNFISMHSTILAKLECFMDYNTLKRNRVQLAAQRRWPGNSIQVFKGMGPALLPGVT